MELHSYKVGKRARQQDEEMATTLYRSRLDSQQTLRRQNLTCRLSSKMAVARAEVRVSPSQRRQGVQG
jgi:hypothetical protein